jgi:hypothetical protein
MTAHPRTSLRKRWLLLSSFVVCLVAIAYLAHEHFSERRHGKDSTRKEESDVPAVDVALDRIWSERARHWLPVPGAPGRVPSRYVFWEAEHVLASNFPASNPFAPANSREQDRLSAGAWIGARDPGRPLYAEYEIGVQHAATYQLYARKFWKHGPFRWRFDDAPWMHSSENVNLLDEETLRKHVVVNWVHLGQATLGAGSHRFRVELSSEAGPSAFDAFLLTDEPFLPRGKRLPGAAKTPAPDGFFSFEPDIDRFEASPMDWRGMNERSAGDGGFVRARGEALVHSDTNEPVRFWGVNVGPDALHQDDDTISYFARRLAKAGVNLVRFHGRLWDESAIERLDRAKVERLHYLVNALKREGIYTALSIYFPHWLELDERRHGFSGYGGERAYGLLFFNERFQAVYQGWWKQLLLEANPHTGRTLAREPALAIVELINEDSLLFGTFDAKRIPAPQMALVEKKFGAWLTAKYGNTDGALRAWKGARLREDAPGEGTMALLPLWKIARDRGPRAQDTAEFLTHLEIELYRKMYRYLREDLGYPAAIVCGNWQTADAEILGPLGKYANAAVCDVMDRHGYHGGPHRGDGAEYSVSTGQEYDDATALRLDWSDPARSTEPPWQWPLLDPGYNGKPSILSEVNWTFPNRFRAELPILAAAYGLLQGTDGVFFFATNAPAWSAKLTKFTLADPVLLGQFPGAARLFRDGMLRAAPLAVRAHRGERQLYALEGAPKIDPRSALVGRVALHVGGTEAGADWILPTLDSHIDGTHRRLESLTSELSWDWGRGLVLLDAPRAQGAVGFLARHGPIELQDVRIESALGYASVLILPLDEEPLSRSRKILVQVMSEASNTGFETEPARGMQRIVDAGGPPVVVRRLSGGILLKRPDLAGLRAIALNPDGYPFQVLSDITAGMPWSPEAFYYIVEPKNAPPLP